MMNNFEVVEFRIVKSYHRKEKSKSRFGDHVAVQLLLLNRKDYIFLRKQEKRLQQFDKLTCKNRKLGKLTSARAYICLSPAQTPPAPPRHDLPLPRLGSNNDILVEGLHFGDVGGIPSEGLQW
jgi:hypothetical protein